MKRDRLEQFIAENRDQFDIPIRVTGYGTA